MSVSRTKSPGRPARGHVIGRRRFAKISEVEGIRLTPAVAADFDAFDKENLSAAERRQILLRKYGERG